MPTVPEYIAGEQWRPVVGWETWYEVSTYGNVRRDPRAGGRAKPGRNLKPLPHDGGYVRVCLCRPGEQQWKFIHDIVAGAFIGNRPAGFEVNHIDTRKTNNAASNLEYGTKLHNVLHACRMGRTQKKLTPEQVKAIREMKGKIPRFKIAELFGVASCSIGDIFAGRTWKHLPEETGN